MSDRSRHKYEQPKRVMVWATVRLALAIVLLTVALGCTMHLQASELAFDVRFEPTLADVATLAAPNPEEH